MITLERAETNNNFLVTILDKEGPKKFECRLDICENPACSCSSVGFNLYPVVSSGLKPDDEDKAVLFYIDIYKRVIDKKKEPLSKKNRYYADIFISHLREEDWKKLTQEFYIYKTRLTDTADLNSAIFIFPIEQIESNGLMIGYKEILPFGGDLFFYLDDLKIVVDDQYCVRSDCSCTDTCLALIPIRKDTIVKKQAVEGLFVNYKTGQWFFKEPGRKISDREKTFKAALEEQQHAVYALLKKRHQTLKRLYQNYRRKILGLKTAAIGPAAIGRNAPCPCGSGKKFKKCCGK
jgi:hypothetical protein